MKGINSQRYIYDALYGPIYLDPIIWKIISSPELQRLREVRLCNINSLCLTGGANVNRYEHAIGTCYLAQQCMNNWPLFNPISVEERKLFLYAALLHDVANAPLGHSLEYIEEKDGYNPEKGFELAVIGDSSGGYAYKSFATQPIFFGLPRELLNTITRDELSQIAQMVRGKGKLGQLISGIIDLDNIDNVYRMAYHIGIIKTGDTPLKLAQSLWIEDGNLLINDEAAFLIEEWYDVRKRLYEILLLNPEEFSGKCMLSDSISFTKLKGGQAPFNWYDVDYELLKGLSRESTIRIPVKEFIFKVQSLEKICNYKPVRDDDLINVAESNGIQLSHKVKVYLNKTDVSWTLKDGSKEYYVEINQEELIFYKIVIKTFDVNQTILRLMHGELYGCIAIYSTKQTIKYSDFQDIRVKLEIEHELSRRIQKFGNRYSNANIALHPILDINKTQRQVIIQTNKGDKITVGTPSKQLLLGVFFRNVDLNMYKIDEINNGDLEKIKEIILEFLSFYLKDNNLNEVQLYAESKNTSIK